MKSNLIPFGSCLQLLSVLCLFCFVLLSCHLGSLSCSFVFICCFCDWLIDCCCCHGDALSSGWHHHELACVDLPAWVHGCLFCRTEWVLIGSHPLVVHYWMIMAMGNIVHLAVCINSKPVPQSGHAVIKSTSTYQATPGLELTGMTRGVRLL